MKYFVTFLLLFISSVSSTSDSEMPKMNFEKHFRALSTIRHPHYKEGVPWREGRDYIKQQMATLGLGPIIEEQVFNTTVGGKPVQGINLIGMEKGGDPTGPIIVVGADYSTSLVGNPLKDNTGGVACLLETIHVFHDRIDWNPNYLNFSVIFVAFDLNTKEFDESANSKSGSYFFVNEWLIPFLNQTLRKKEFLGAVILDSVTTYNTLNETQLLPQGFEQGLPSAYNDIKANGEKGDFIGLLYTANTSTHAIVTTYHQLYNRDRKLRPFRLQNMEVALPKIIKDDVLNMFNHQAQFHFWTASGITLPAFLLFDTDQNREDPLPNACNVNGCNVDEFLTKERIGFMTYTTQTLVFTLLDLQTTPYEVVPSGGSDASFNFFLVSFSTILLGLVLKFE